MSCLCTNKGQNLGIETFFLYFYSFRIPILFNALIPLATYADIYY